LSISQPPTIHPALIRVIEGHDKIPFVRVEENNPVSIKKVLDSGSYGIIVPMIRSLSDAKRAIESVYYPPKGVRGVGLSRAQNYGQDFEKYRSWYKKNISIILQIEHIDAVDNLKDILRLKDVNATIIGPYDLSASLGLPGQLKNRKVKQAIEKYKNICKKFNKPSGIHVISPNYEEAEKFKKQGFKLIVLSVDMIFLKNKIATELSKIKSK